MNPILSMTKNAKNIECVDTRAVAVIEAVRSGRWREPVARIRAEYQRAGKSAVDELKKWLPGVLWCGKFERRCNAGLVADSGLLCADQDNLGDRLAEVRERLLTSPHLYALFLSPTATGLKAVFRVPTDATLHARSFGAVAAHVRQLCGDEVDLACKDLARLCFVSYDPDAFLNRDAVELPPLAESPTPKKSAAVPAPPCTGTLPPFVDRLLATGAQEGERNDQAFKLACQLRDVGMTESDAANRILEFAARCKPALATREALATLRSAYATPAREPARRKEPLRAASEGTIQNDPEGVAATLPRASRDDEAFTNLAKLPPAEYDRLREAEAEKLGIRLGTLDAEVAKRRPEPTGDSGDFPIVEPWPDPVAGAELANGLLATFKKFIVADEPVLVAATLWSLWTWVFDLFDVAVMLIITAPTKRAGKSKLLSILLRLVAKPFTVSSATPAGIYRTIELHQPTLLIDEVDAFLKGDEQLRGLINSGHTRDAAFHLGCVPSGDGWEPVRWSTWCPKVLSGIGRLAPTLEDRAVILNLRRRRKDEAVTRLRYADRFDDLRRQLARWSQDSADALRKSDPALPDALNDRAADNWTPLLAIADLIGGDWPKIAREAAITLAGEAEMAADDMIESLIRDIRKVFKADRISSAELCQELAGLEGSRWSDWDHGKGLSKSKLARLLSPLGIHPDSVKFPNGKTLKGYVSSQFQEIWSRYCPDSDPSKRNNGTSPVVQRESTLFESGTEAASSVSKSEVSTNNDGASSVVPFSPPDSGQGDVWQDGSPITDPPGDLPPVDADGQRVETAAEEVLL